MASQLILAPVVRLPPVVNGEPTDTCTAESESQVTTQQGGEDNGRLEPGEVLASEIKQEERTHDNSSNPFLKYHTAPNDHSDRGMSPFAHVAAVTSPVTPFRQSDGASIDVPRPTNAIQRRNHARLSDIVTRLQNFNGSVTELLAVASVQQQLDMAFADLERAGNQLKDVFRQFELQGHISNRQCHKKNGATRDLTRASQRIVQLTKELCDLQRREPNAC